MLIASVFLCAVFCSLVAIPVYVKHNISFREGSSQGRFELTLGPKQTMGKAVESVLVSSQLPRGVLNANLTPSQGTYTFDPVTKVHLTFCLLFSHTVVLFLFTVHKSTLYTLFTEHTLQWRFYLYCLSLKHQSGSFVISHGNSNSTASAKF